MLDLQTLEHKTIEPKKRITREMIIAASLSIAAITQLSMPKSFEAVRKYADM